MKKYMLIFSLGSIQPFIEQARKTRDLWLGSFLIAKLMEAAMREVEEEFKKENLPLEFAFPTERTLQKRYATLPHKFIALFESENDAQEAVVKSKTGMRKRWDNLRDKVWKEVIPEEYQNDATLRNMWDEQSDLETCFQVFWVIVEGDPTSYPAWLEDAENALEARKRLKDFPFREEPGEKSTISGERAALHRQFDDSESRREQVRKFWKKLADKRTAREIDKNGDERLDAVDTIKRFALESPIIRQIAEGPEQTGNVNVFPSTSSIATATFVERLLAEDVPLANWLNATEGIANMSPNAIPYLRTQQQNLRRNQDVLRRDGDCFFKETFTASRMEKDYGVLPERSADRAAEGRKGLKALFETSDELCIRRPTPYYAIVKMDGDRMGDVLHQLNQDEHVKISKSLSSFARVTAPSLIDGRFPGRLVYAGGDDVLALVPLARDLTEEERDKDNTIHTLLDLVYQLRLQYGEIPRQVPNINGPFTASIGVAVAHHYTPLSAVLRATREAEKLAKDRYDRNALVVTIMRRSGEQTRVGCHWEYKDLRPEAQPIPLFSKFYDLFDQDILSPKSIFTLLEEAPTLVSLRLEREEDKRAAQASEIKRVLRRQRNEKKRDLLQDETARLLADDLVKLAAEIDKETDEQHKNDADFEKSPYLHEDTKRYGLVEVLGWLLVMAFLTRKEQD